MENLAMAKTMDIKCYNLAVEFLKDVKAKVTDEDRNELGLEIQQTIEDFISALLEDNEDE